MEKRIVFLVTGDRRSTIGFLYPARRENPLILALSFFPDTTRNNQQSGTDHEKKPNKRMKGPAGTRRFFKVVSHALHSSVCQKFPPHTLAIVIHETSD